MSSDTTLSRTYLTYTTNIMLHLNALWNLSYDGINTRMDHFRVNPFFHRLFRHYPTIILQGVRSVL